jgi:opacity protein-like surface antigen
MRRSADCLLLVTFMLLLPAAPAAAQEPAAARAAAAAIARVPPGSMVRVQTLAGEVLEGTLRLGRDSVRLEAGSLSRAVALEDVRSVWYRQRETWPAARAGALIGAAGGGAWLGLLGLTFGATAGETVTFMAVGALGGAAAGGLLGGVVGSALPRWTLVYPDGGGSRVAVPAVTAATDAPLDAPAGRRRLGSIEGAVGYGAIAGDESTSGGVGGRLGLHAEFGAEPRAARLAPHLSIGPEIGRFGLGTTGTLRRAYPPADTVEFSRQFSATTAGGVLRGGVGTTRLRGYALLGLSYNRWTMEDRDKRWLTDDPNREIVGSGQRTFEHIGYTAGAGAQATLARRAAAGLELRHTSVGTFDMDLPGSYWTLTLSAARRW